MSTFIFVDLLAYAGAGMGALGLLYLGAVLMRPSSAVKGLAAFIGEDRARECFMDGSFKPSQARALGSLFLFLAAFIAVCVIRGVSR
jgi:hypothetical protein